MKIFNTVREALRHGKDTTTSFLLERFLHHKLAGYGRMLNFSIDSQEKKARVELLLKGEAVPVIIHVEEYELISEGGSTFLLVKKASSSRQWINALLTDFLLHQKIPLPEKYANIVKLAL